MRISAGATPTHDPAYCHCNHCRLFHGAPFALEAGWSLDDCEISGGDTTIYRSSKRFERHRCAACGTPCAGIHRGLKAAFLPTTLLAEAGAARLPFLLQPKIHLFYSRRIVGDLFATDGLPKYDTFPP